MATCRSCGAEIVWLQTNSGKRIPVDAETCPDGEAERLYQPEHGHVSHFATCPQAGKWRKPRNDARK